jgi:hypothetical protein
MDGQCLKSNIVYRAEITTEEGDHGTYIGTSGNTFKIRYGGHKNSFRYSDNRNKTELSKFYWKLKDEGKTPNIKWSIIKEVKSGPNLKACTLCNTERYMIAQSENERLLNTRNERKRVCPHYTSMFFRPLDYKCT